jgi:3',5'-cyclic AMP phosphodiesterase CpdA
VRVVAHISDLHFGRTDAAVVSGLKQAVAAAEPDLVVVSGDLTQRARSREFEEARAFLAALPQPKVVVPGNHDVPLYNPLTRWLRPLARYRRYIGDETQAFYADSEIAVLGINTARTLALKNGRINSTQVVRACGIFRPLGENVVRMVVTHHPFSLPEVKTPHRVMGRAKMALAAFAACKVDVVLSGHLHASHTGLADSVSAGSHAALLVQAGTATSSRTRQEPNAFNLLRIENPYVTIEHHNWTGQSFVATSRERFQRHGDGWIAAKPGGATALDTGTIRVFPH